MQMQMWKCGNAEIMNIEAIAESESLRQAIAPMEEEVDVAA